MREGEPEGARDLFCCTILKYDSVLSQSVKIWHFCRKILDSVLWVEENIKFVFWADPAFLADLGSTDLLWSATEGGLKVINFRKKSSIYLWPEIFSVQLQPCSKAARKVMGPWHALYYNPLLRFLFYALVVKQVFTPQWFSNVAHIGFPGFPVK